MLNLDRFLSCPSLVLDRAARTGLDWPPCVCVDGRDDEKLGDIVVRPVTVDGWVTESRERDVGADDGDTASPASTFNPALSHIECCWAGAPAK